LTQAVHRPRPPPLRLRDAELLLRLAWPRELAAFCEEPLEYPENASERELLLRWVVVLVERAD
jgi:hypothetical protein